VWGHWDEPYVTLKPAYEAAQIGVFGQMVLRGHIYRWGWGWLGLGLGPASHWALQATAQAAPFPSC
jgi:isoleucyl-tRNA synthetase